MVGRTKFLSSIVLIFNGLALLFLNLKNKEFLFQTLALIAGFLAFFGFTGNIYGARIFQGGDWYVQMALLSSIVHIVLSIAIIFNRPDKGWMSIITSPQSGGIITRLLLGNLLIIIFALGLLRIIGEYIGLFGGRTGTVIIVVSTSVLLLILILLSANKLNIIDEKREIAVKKIKRLEQFYENIIESINEGIFVTDNNDKVVYYNDSFKKITGMDKFDVMGTDILEEIPKENVEGFLKHYLEAKDTLKPVYYESIPLMTPDSKKFFTGWIIPQVNGEFKGALCTIIDDTERKNASDLIENSLKEKEMLLGEIHHRVKNNLQIISSLLNLQSMHIKDPQDKDLFTESQNRVKSMAIIHEKLYQSQNFTKINLKDYTNSLVKDIMGTYMIDPDQIKIDINAENIELNLETAIPSGLIINELITNSIKHAFPDGQEGKIDVYFEKKDNKYILKIADNGVGFPPNLDLENAQTLGLELVNNLIKQLDGSIELVTNHGTSFKITFPEMEYKKRI
ncbi:MAG: sensor histidine kinase [Methanomicrobiales archaeon]